MSEFTWAEAAQGSFTCPFGFDTELLTIPAIGSVDEMRVCRRKIKENWFFGMEDADLMNDTNMKVIWSIRKDRSDFFDKRGLDEWRVYGFYQVDPIARICKVTSLKIKKVEC